MINFYLFQIAVHFIKFFHIFDIFSCYFYSILCQFSSFYDIFGHIFLFTYLTCHFVAFSKHVQFFLLGFVFSNFKRLTIILFIFFRLLFLSFYSKAPPSQPQCHEAQYHFSNICLSTSLCSMVLPKWGNLFYCQNSRFHPI